MQAHMLLLHLGGVNSIGIQEGLTDLSETLKKAETATIIILAVCFQS